MKRLADNVYSFGDHSYDRPILGLIAGKKDSLIVDAGDSSEHAWEFQNEIRKLGAAPLRYLVLTHHHDDHTTGLSEWEQVTSISSKATRERVQGIDISFHNELIIDLGDVTCLIKEIPSSHSTDSTIVYIPERRVLFLGDALYTTRINGEFHYSSEITLDMIDALKQYDTDHYVFSHIPLCESNRFEVKFFLDKLEFIARRAQLSSLDAIQEAFATEYGRQPSQDEVFMMNCFF